MQYNVILKRFKCVLEMNPASFGIALLSDTALQNFMRVQREKGPLNLFQRPSAQAAVKLLVDVHAIGAVSKMPPFMNAYTLQTRSIYKITCTATERVYIGVADDPQKRFKQHKAEPPQRMKTDAETYKPFVEFFKLFKLEIPEKSYTRKSDKSSEAKYIRYYNATGEKGYNQMLGNPASTKQYWAIKRARR